MKKTAVLLIVTIAASAGAREPGLRGIRDAEAALLEQSGRFREPSFTTPVPAAARPPRPEAAVPAGMGGFQSYQDHCAAGHSELQVRSGGAGAMLGTSAWAEGGVCLPISLGALLQAAQAVEVMVWDGATKLNGVEAITAPRGAFSALRIQYEARHYNFLSCRTGQWPMEWSFLILRGTPQAPEQAAVDFLRTPGGNGNGGYIKHWAGRIELSARATGAVSLHMRYEIAAPGQKPDWAAGAVRGYIERLKTRAAGGALPGPVADPACPY